MPSNSMLPRSLRAGVSNASVSHGSFNGGDLNDVSGRTENSSVINGIEHVDRSRPGGEDTRIIRSRTHREPRAIKAKSDAYTEITNKSLALEQTDFMIQQLEGKPDSRVQRTYVNGQPLEEVVSGAPVLTVGLRFLPGADKPQVNRTEQIDMEGKEADQKDALWRVATAGSLLRQFIVSSDLQIVQQDDTPAILERARSQAHERDRFSDPRMSLALRKRPFDAVTIDSAKVTVVNDLRMGNWDVRGLLIEVDWSSMWDLMVNYRNLIAGGGPDMTFEETKTLLETMIEDARRLCIRSPILFRMSTRVSIINSENTRYGINHGGMFRTLTTSKGIKEIISLSAAYYNSLDPPGGSSDITQKYIRPQFLQMIVLLMSLLNNEDLAEIKSFLETTYKIKADRRDVELLILKVVPLLSINPQVFLTALIPTVEGFPLESVEHTDEGYSHVWNVFIKSILADGYLLPGTVDDHGRNRLSWIVKWPEEGFKSTAIFNALQYAGRLRTINDIPPVEIHPSSDSTELTVVMTDDSKYNISPADLDSIVYMTPGCYPIQETGGSTRSFDLIVQELPLNTELCQAIKMTNEIVYTVNQWLANAKRNHGIVNKLRRKAEPQPFLSDVLGTGRLVEVFATLNQEILAITYKADGRKISRIDAEQNMARDARQLHRTINYIEQRGDIADQGFFSAEKRELKQRLDQVKVQIGLAEQSRMKLGKGQEISNEPIVKCLYPEGTRSSDVVVWNGYKAWCQENNGYLQTEAICSTIQGVRWLTGEVIELSLGRAPWKIFVTPIRPVPEGYRDDEARLGETAVLLGKFVAVGERDPRDRPEVLTMINCLRIVSMEEQTATRRGRNRVVEEVGRERVFFK